MGARRREAVYLAGAVPVRIVTSGVGVALALAAAERLGDVAIGGVLIAVLNAPIVLAAPLVGAVSDAARSPKRLMLGSALVLAGALAIAAFLGEVPLPVVLVALVAAGAVSPVFLGALSAWVDEAMPGDPARGFAVDALSYNVAGIAGPAVVAGMSALLTPTGALLALAVVSVAGGLLLQILPIASRGGSLRPGAIAAGIGAAARHLATHGPIRRVAIGGAVVLVGAGMMPVVVVLVAVQQGLPASAGGVLLTAFSIGGVTGALLVATPPVTRWLARFSPWRVMALGFAGTGVFTLLAAASGSFALTAVALGLSGLPDAPAIAAMLRLRLEESPTPVRAQIFVLSAGLRNVATAVGAGLAGVLAGLAPALLLVLVAVGWFAAAPILLLRRREA